MIMRLAVYGLDYECLDPRRSTRSPAGLNRRFARFGENFRIYQYPHQARSWSFRAVATTIRLCSGPSRTAWRSIPGERRSLYSLEVYFVVVYEGWQRSRCRAQTACRTFSGIRRQWLRQWFSAQSTAPRCSHKNQERAREVLANKVMHFVVQLPDALHIEVLDKQPAFRFLRRLLNYAPTRRTASGSSTTTFVDFQACGSALECHRDHLRLDDFYVSGPHAQGAAGADVRPCSTGPAGDSLQSRDRQRMEAGEQRQDAPADSFQAPPLSQQQVLAG